MKTQYMGGFLIVRSDYRVWNAGLVAVRQTTSKGFTGKSWLEAPRISWAAVSLTDIPLAEKMNAALRNAIRVAELWVADTGKDTTAVLITEST